MPLLGTLGAATAKATGFTAVPAELPGTPTIGTATVIGGVAVSVSYTAPAFDGNTSILSYTAVAYNHPSGTVAGITGIAFGPNSGNVTVSGLTSGASYTFRVFATNGIGNSGQSGSSNNVTTWVVPGAPTIGAVTYTIGNSFASVAYTQPASNGGTPITSYTATAYVSGVATALTGTILQATSGSITVNGLVAGTAYTFRVFATNLVGNSVVSGASSVINVFTKPDAPNIGTATFTGGTSATVGFTAPANNGGASISSYTVRAYVSGVVTAITGSGTTSPLSITGLTKGTLYTFRVTATNTYGTSDPSADSNSITPLTVPAAPTIGTPLATSGTAVNVNFTAPTDTGGNSTYITSYTATSTPGSISVTKSTGLPTPGATSVINIPGLTKGTAYTFTVFATNPIGNSANSAVSASITPADVPNAPTITTVTAPTTNTGITASAVVNYTAPADNGGATITSYTATSSPGGLTGTITQAGSGAITVNGLTKGTAYTFTVVATNRVGNSANSNTSASVTPITVPNAPTALSAVPTGTTSATVSYTNSSDTGGTSITSYTATSSPGGLTGSASSGTITVNGLTKGQSYTFTITATNAVGTGAASAASNSITTWVEPGAPTGIVATATSGTSASIAFTASASNGGTAITSYTATSTPGSITGTINQSGSGSIAIVGLTKGTTYTFRVTATNSVGTGAASAASNSITPADVPNAPTITSVTTSAAYTTSGQVVVNFTAPADNGGNTIVSYTATSSPGGLTGTISQSGSGSITVSGLTKGTAYTFRVVATNAVGSGAASAASSSITPLTVPNAPTSVAVTITGGTTASISYTAPVDTGGFSLITYSITTSPVTSTTTTSSTSASLSGLTIGTAYTFSVIAINIQGNSSAGTTTGTTWNVPNTPTIGTATRASGTSISLTYFAPGYNGGTAITSYTATSSPGGITATVNQATGGTITITGLTSATAYTFTVFATNAIGNSANSASSNSAITAVAPNAPTIGTATTTAVTTSSGTATVSFTAPSDGGSTITSYTATSFPYSYTGTVNQSGSGTITVTGLARYQSYTFTVTATNAFGTSAASAASNSINVPGYAVGTTTGTQNETSSTNRYIAINGGTLAANTTVYYTISGSGITASDFTSGTLTGSVSFNSSGAGSLDLFAAEDHFTEGNESYTVYFYWDSGRNYLIAQTDLQTIIDTSLNYGVVTISPTTATRNIVKTASPLVITGSFYTNMSSGAVGTIVNQPITYTDVFSNVSISPTSHTFTALNQCRQANWSVTTNATDYPFSSYNVTYASVLDTSDPTIPNNYPTHAITLTRIAYTQNITVSPTSGTPSTMYTYTLTGAPGTQFQAQNSVGGPVNTYTLSGSPGDASAGTYSVTDQFWLGQVGTFTVYARWLATGHGDSWFGASAGYATNTRATVTVSYPAITLTFSPASGGTGQVGSPFTGNQTVYTDSGTQTVSATGGAGGPYTFAVTGGSLPPGVSVSSAGVFSGTPSSSGFYSATITATGASSLTGSSTFTTAIVAAPAITGYGVSPTSVTAGDTATLTWSSSGTNSVALTVTGASQGNQSSNGSFGLVYGSAFANQTLSGTLTPRALNYSSLGPAQTFSWTIYGVPTATISVTPAEIWADGASYFSASWSSTNYDRSYFYINGTQVVTTASGTSSPGPYSDTSDVTFSTTFQVANGATFSAYAYSYATNIVRAVPTVTASYTASGGGNVTVNWSTANATSVTDNAGIVIAGGSGLNGTWSGNVPAGTYNVTFTATRTIGIGTRTGTFFIAITVT